MSLSKAKRKVDDEHRLFQENSEVDYYDYFLFEFRGNATCLICRKKIAVLKDHNVKQHYSTKHAEEYSKYQGEARSKQAAQLKKGLSIQQNLFQMVSKEADSAVKASFVEEIDAAYGDVLYFTEVEVGKCEVSLWKMEYSVGYRGGSAAVGEVSMLIIKFQIGITMRHFNGALWLRTSFAAVFGPRLTMTVTM
ncbi:hypothetical protein F2P81_019858 [Scophthalmus maximus]|uniref:SPIN-DOC-like zinc-finger domain-containing protein n=1 Tax=Scophthalmus maximus TaxID=52904 RepID=A0A6A4S281_SCOMX|nr:hypothetical protein F2P81_019858 [Scophthalmus maximus]